MGLIGLGRVGVLAPLEKKGKKRPGGVGVGERSMWYRSEWHIVVRSSVAAAAVLRSSSSIARSIESRVQEPDDIRTTSP